MLLVCDNVNCRAATMGAGGVVNSSSEKWASAIVHGRRGMESSVRGVLSSKIDTAQATRKLHKTATG